MFRNAQTLNGTSHLPERKREKRRTREKPTETKTHTEELKLQGYSEEHQRNVCLVMNGGLFYHNPELDHGYVVTEGLVAPCFDV